METTSYVMYVSYIIENVHIENRLIKQEFIKPLVEDKLKELEGKETLPSHLEFLHSKHDFGTGMTGVAFKDKNTDKVIIGYTGSNNANQAPMLGQ